MAATEWPESTYFVVGGGQHGALVRRMRKVAGARLSPSPLPDQRTLADLRASLIRRRGRRRLSRVTLYAGLVALILVVAWVLERR